MSTTETREPNLFDLKGHDVHVNYSTSSIAGVPLFNYESKGEKKSFRGDEIRVQETEVGRLVTVTLEVVPDLRSVTFSVLVPTVHLEGREGEVHTVGLRTTTRTSIGGPRLVKGQVNTFEGVNLKGTAQAVDF